MAFFSIFVKLKDSSTSKAFKVDTIIIMIQCNPPPEYSDHLCVCVYVYTLKWGAINSATYSSKNIVQMMHHFAKADLNY